MNLAAIEILEEELKSALKKIENVNKDDAAIKQQQRETAFKNMVGHMFFVARTSAQTINEMVLLLDECNDQKNIFGSELNKLQSIKAENELKHAQEIDTLQSQLNIQQIRERELEFEIEEMQQEMQGLLKERENYADHIGKLNLEIINRPVKPTQNQAVQTEDKSANGLNNVHLATRQDLADVKKRRNRVDKMMKKFNNVKVSKESTLSSAQCKKPQAEHKERSHDVDGRENTQVSRGTLNKIAREDLWATYAAQTQGRSLSYAVNKRERNPARLSRNTSQDKDLLRQELSTIKETSECLLKSVGVHCAGDECGVRAHCQGDQYDEDKFESNQFHQVKITVIKPNIGERKASYEHDHEVKASHKFY